MSLGELSQKIREFADERDWGQFHSPRNLIFAIQAEVGELSELVQWTSDAELDGDWITRHRNRLGEEMADVLIYLVRLSDVLGVDLEAAADDKIRLNGQKYPIEHARGNAKKYTEFEERH